MKKISYIFPFSAKSKDSLEATSTRVMQYIKETEKVDLEDAAWTLQKGRRAYDLRKAIVSSRTELENESFYSCRGIGSSINRKKNLVFLLPEGKDIKGVWEQEVQEYTNYPVQIYKQTKEQLLKLFPEKEVQQITDGRETSDTVEGYRAFISGYAFVTMLQVAGLAPTALAGEGVGEITAFSLAGAISLREAIQILMTYGVRANYEAIFQEHPLGKKRIPVMRKAGKKAKLHMDEAIVIRLAGKELQNDITRRCMVDVAIEDQLVLIENEFDTLEFNVNRLLAQLWCKGTELDWNHIAGGRIPNRIPLPTYVFERKEYDCDVRFGGFLQSEQNTKESSTLSPIEEPSDVLLRLWKEIFGGNQPQKSDDFFELGGSSLDAIMLASKLKEILKIECQMADIFDNPTYGKLEKFLTAHKQDQLEDEIPKLGRQQYYETSSAQKRMYAVNELLDEDAIPYNLATVYKIEGKLDKEKIQNCFATLVKRHEAFRTRFQMVRDEIVQVIEENVDFQVEFATCTNENLNEEITAHIKPFDLARAPLLRVAILSISENEHVMIFDMHHIISDQSSMEILIREIGMIYQGIELPEIEIQYKDFAKWQNDFIRNGEVKKQLDYWKQEFSNGIPVLNLYTDFERPETMQSEGGIVHIAFDEKMNQHIIETTKKYAITPYMFSMAALNILLWKYTRQKDIVIGTAIAGRQHAKLESIVGMFVNTLAIKSDIQEEYSIPQFLQYIKDKMVSAYDNQDCQFDMLVEELGIPKNMSRNALFDILFNYINIGTGEVEIEGLKLTPFNDDSIDSKFDITFTLEEKDQKFTLDIEYAKALYRQDTIELMGQRFVYVINQMLEEAVNSIGEITIITEEEREWQIHTVNQTATQYPSDKTVLQLFEECVQEAPDSIAIEWMEEKITYRQLNNMANQLAQILAEKNVGYQDFVPILLERGYMQMVSILGIMKLGAVYIPVDPKFPVERIQYILNDCKGNVLVTSTDLKEKANSGIEIVDLDAQEYKLDRNKQMDIHSKLTPKQLSSEDLIYIIYTSGSTGNPKGTLLKHKNVIRVVRNTNYIEITSEDRVMQISNYVFDCSVFDIYSALLNKACLVIIPRETALEIPLLAEFIKEKKISAFCISTALFHMLADWKPEALIDVRKIIVAGEQISLPHAKRTIDVIGKGKLINCYGPTESAVFATYYPIDDLTDLPIVPIGYPLANTTVYITDEQKHILPINVPGELCLGGDGIGRGYLNQEELTSEKFTTMEEAGGVRIYRTGDKVMWNTRRQLIFLGRMDFQIKLRGFRVELGEVERYIEAIDGVKKAVVIADTDNLGTTYMIAYYILEDYSKKNECGEKYIRSVLESKLPEYMIPSKYMLLKQFPLNFSGKVDRKSLPKVEEVIVREEKVTDPPRTPLETKILETMKTILDIEELGIRDDFFLSGGQSIKAIALTKELNKQGIQVKVNEIFQYTTTEKLAALLEPNALMEQEIEEPSVSNIVMTEKQINQLVTCIISSTENVVRMLQGCNEKQQFPMSAIQKGHSSQGAEHSGFIKEISGRYTEQQVKKAIGAVLCENQLLHCKLTETNNQVQWVELDIDEMKEVLGYYIAYFDISMYTEEVRNKVLETVSKAMFQKEIEKDAILWRNCILKTDEQHYSVIWSSNHIIFDAMSGEVILHQLEMKLKKMKSDVPVKSYDKYVELLQKGPQEITEDELVEKFQLEKWSDRNQKLMDGLKKGETGDKKQITLSIPLTEDKKTDIWWYAFNLVSGILKKYAEVEEVPFAIVDYGRCYQEENFYNSVGEFLDIIPIISAEGQPISIEAILADCREKSVNFMSLLLDNELSETYAHTQELLKKYYVTESGKFNFVLYNFQGFVTGQEKEAFENVEEEEIAKLCVTVNYDDENLYVELDSMGGLQEEKILEMKKQLIEE